MAIASAANVYLDNAYVSKISRLFGKGHHLPLDLSAFSRLLAADMHLVCNRVYIYTAPPFQSSPCTEEETRRRASYDHWISKLRRLPHLTVREGRCQRLGGSTNRKELTPC